MARGFTDRRPATTAAGFTLLEMVVVIGIIAIIAGIGIGSTIGLGARTQTEAVEQLMTDMVRQARHTSLSTGAPVELTVSQSTGNAPARIAGVSQLPVYTQSFDDVHNLVPDDQPNGLAGGLPGVGGMAWILGLPDNPSDPSSIYSDGVIDPQNLLVPRIPDTDGIFISLWVKPLSLSQTGQTWMPLLHLGPSDDPDAASIGLVMAVESRTIQLEDGGTSASLNHWVPVGFVDGVNSGTRLVGSSDADDLHPSSGDVDVTGVIVGDRWVELGLLMTPQETVLYRDGQEIVRAAGLSTSIASGSQVWIGRDSDPSIIPTGAVDNVRVYHLASGSPTNLPVGVEPQSDYRILLDGTTAQVVGGTTIRFELRDQAPVAITVNGDGSVTSEVLP